LAHSTSASFAKRGSPRPQYAWKRGIFWAICSQLSNGLG
jgi:hypothetical protein